MIPDSDRGDEKANTPTHSLTVCLTCGAKQFDFRLTPQLISWRYKKKHPFLDKETKWSCRVIVPIEEVVSVEYKELEVRSTSDDAGDQFEMSSFAKTAFCLHYATRSSNNLWRLKSAEFHCKTTSECTNIVEEIKGRLNKYGSRPKSLLVFVNPFGGKKQAPKIFTEKVAPIFDIAGITSHVIVTQKADHAKEYIESHGLGRYNGIVCVGGDGMFAELLNGLLRLHNQGVDMDDEHQKLHQPPIRIGVIPAGSTDTIVYCTTGINDPVTSALHIVLGDSMSVDVCSVRRAYSGQLIRFCVSILGYGFYGDVLKDSEQNRWMGPVRYDWSGFKTFLKLKNYPATVEFLPAPILDHDHHPGLENGKRCYRGCGICKSASLLALNGSYLERSFSATGEASSSSLYPDSDYYDESEAEMPRRPSSVCLDDSLSDLSLVSRPGSSLSRIPTESWTTVTGQFIGITALTISCRCPTVPHGVSPACHLGDGSSDLILVNATSRFDYLKHLIRIKAKNSSQFDFNFVDVHRVKAFRVRVKQPVGGDQSSTSFHRLNEDRTLDEENVSCWNCDGEVIAEPNVDVRVHCQLVKIFARGIEENPKQQPGKQCTSDDECLICTRS